MKKLLIVAMLCAVFGLSANGNSQGNGRGTRQRGFSHPTLAREEQKPRRRFKKTGKRLFGADVYHEVPPPQQLDFAGALDVENFTSNNSASSLRSG